MHYQGGKSRIAKEVSEVILTHVGGGRHAHKFVLWSMFC